MKDKGEFMQESLEALKHHSIISPDEIQSLRHFLLKNNPDLTDSQRAQLFAKCLHKKLDEALVGFDISLQKNIKRCLIQKTVSKSDFTINALDILESYTQVETVSPSNIEELTSWVNQYEPQPVSEDMLLSLTHSLTQGSAVVQPRSIAEPIIVPTPTHPKLTTKKTTSNKRLSINKHSNIRKQSALSKQPTIRKQSIQNRQSILNRQLATSKQITLTKQPTLSKSATLSKPTKQYILNLSYLKRHVSLCLLAACFLILSYTFHVYQTSSQQRSFSNFADVDISFSIPLTVGRSANYLQEHLQYKTINESGLKSWLKQRQSTLANEPYFSSIINTAKAFNINPLLLFAITGQEQNFVPSTHEASAKIANNPFNLYGSWQEYNTSIEDATRIVARTIIRLGKDCPKDQDQIQWINQRYAADPNWHIGVTYFLNELEAASSTASLPLQPSK